MLDLELVMTLHVKIAPALEVGEVGAGFRRVIPITGGSFEGPAIQGQVVPGGADWNLTRPDGVAEVWARYTLQTDDGVLVGVTNAGLIVPQPDGSLYARTSPQFEVAGERYVWLRHGVFAGTLTPVVGGGAVQLQFSRVSCAPTTPRGLHVRHNGKRAAMCGASRRCREKSTRSRCRFRPAQRLLVEQTMSSRLCR